MFPRVMLIRSILSGRANAPCVPLSIYPVTDLHSKILDTHPHLGPFFSVFMQFPGQFGQIIDWRPYGIGASLWEILDLPLA